MQVEMIERKILLIRGEKVMLDSDLAGLYDVEVKHLKRQVKRNLDRFPTDFMIQLSKEEYESLRRHFGTLKRGEHSKYLPTFTILPVLIHRNFFPPLPPP
ncbi:MAG: ORF6N domain-containing protein [Nitrospirae bacterium]|nr:ORF6N domain-containing protein [Nitrospirota bacterium]